MTGLKTFLAAGLLAIADLAGAATLAETVRHDWFAPRTEAFVRDSAALVPAVQAICVAPPESAAAGLEQARARWLAALASWERLSGVAIGPVLQRRSQRQIDFTPTRPRMIETAIKAAPETTADMELVGTPAKGLPALEWLLWTKPVEPGSPACSYAVQVALEIGREAEALAAAQPAPADDAAVLSELVNQWVGGIERLRWPGMEMPVRVAMTSVEAAEADFPRRASGAAAQAWAAQWDTLRALATTGAASFDGLLRARDKAATAAVLADAVAAADAALHGLTQRDRERILAAAQTLAALKRLVEAEVAPALGVSIGFSDADGD